MTSVFIIRYIKKMNSKKSHFYQKEYDNEYIELPATEFVFPDPMSRHGSNLRAIFLKILFVKSFITFFIAFSLRVNIHIRTNTYSHLYRNMQMHTQKRTCTFKLIFYQNYAVKLIICVRDGQFYFVINLILYIH